jgi:DNA-binding response OmpR family regulator
MNLNSLTLTELEAKQERLLNALCRVRVAMQRHRGTESVEQQIARIPKKQRAFVKTLLDARGRTVTLMDIEKNVWNGREKSEDYFRAFVGRIEKTFGQENIPLFIDISKRENGDVIGYKIQKIRKKKF